MSEAPDLERMLRRMRRREGLRPLIAALGLEPLLEPLPRAGWREWGMDGDEDLKALVVAGASGSLVALVLELAADPVSARVAPLARRIRSGDPSRQYLLLCAGPGYRRLMFACFGLEGELRHLTVERARVRRTDVEALSEMMPAASESGLALAVRYARALDRTRVTRRFFEDFAARRARVAAAWTGIAADARDEREQLALLFLCRLMFLYFLQRRGHLEGDRSYVRTLWRRWCRTSRLDGTSFYRDVVEPLFFGVLNTRPVHRSAAARALGDLPYLNGGLFERHALERRHRRLDLPDAVVADVLDDLYERYRFTTRDTADEHADGAADAAVDPEMLGRVFEGMMAGALRGDTGTFYTPAAAVDRLVSAALVQFLEGRGVPAYHARAALEQPRSTALDPAARAAITRAVASVRVLDPACGSGAFLLGALSRIAALREQLAGESPAEVRREIVGSALHGVDLQGDAALLCALRLWLALAVETERACGVPPLPNLDRRIRQGDALLDPLELGEGPVVGAPERAASNDAAVRRALRGLAPAARRYLTAEPAEKPALRRELDRREADLARTWLAAVDGRLACELAELTSVAASRDLFGDETTQGRAARARMAEVRRRREQLAAPIAALREHGALPFFSFRVHFADAAAGFDIVVSNPPWVRARRWPASVGRLIRARYRVCRSAGWRGGAALAGAPAAAAAQVDLSQLFLERSLGLLAPRGCLAMLLPAKTFRSLYGGAARRLLLEDAALAAIEDHSLDPRGLFQADAFAGAVVARRNAPSANGAAPDDATRAPVAVTMTRRGAATLAFDVRAAELPLFPNDPESPWLLAPDDVRRALRTMQGAGPPLGTHPDLRVRRGVFTGANHVLIVREVSPKLGGLCRVRAEGERRAGRSRHAREAGRYEAIIESSGLRPLLRGCDVSAWNCELPACVIWVHGDDGRAAPPPPRLRRYLSRHDRALRARSGLPPGAVAGSLFRVSPAALGHKVVWHDLAATLNAAAVPDTMRTSWGERRPVIPLNTVYFIPTASEHESLLLAAYLNSSPLRAFARAIAERAKDAHFRFFAWTVASLPLPRDWRDPPAAEALLRISARAHRDRGISSEAAQELDAAIASIYGLSAADRAALSGFDRWLRGEP